MWNRLAGIMSDIIGNGISGFSKCEFKQCYIEHDRLKKPMNFYDAVVFNMNELHNSGKFPWEENYFLRTVKQIFIFMSLEPPMYTWGSSGKVNISEVKLYTTFFNLSMSYRADADVNMVFGRKKRYFKVNLTNANSMTDIKKLKFKHDHDKEDTFIVWVSSHCPTPGRREDYVNKLKSYIHVDSFGECGDYFEGCERSEHTGDSPEECYRVLERKYKFYLSFENSLCTDYVTEKFFWILKHDMVPVVYGHANYSHIAPPYSYIDATHLNPKELAAYLIKLNKNDVLYNKYFNWKKNF